MDSLTQIVLGAAVGEVVLGKKIGNKALLFGAIAGTIPDLDIFQSLIAPMISHRGFTHSFFFAFLMSPILAWLMLKIFKDREKTLFTDKAGFLDKFVKRFFRSSGASFKEWTTLYFWGFVTHILLDVQTIYGTELLWPFKLRLTTANVFVADPLYTLPFLLCVIAVSFFSRHSKIRAKINYFGLIISSSYLLLTMVFKGITYQKFTNSLAEQNITYQRIETGPTPLNSILWFANVETETQYMTGTYSLLDKEDDIKFFAFDKNPVLRKKLKNYETIKKLNHFAKGWYILSETADGYDYTNLRFGAMTAKDGKPNYVFKYKLTMEGEKMNWKEDFNRKEKMGDMRSLFGALWERIKGNK
jgi:inner membrane protein